MAMVDIMEMDIVAMVDLETVSAVVDIMDIVGHRGAILMALLLLDQEHLIQMFITDQEEVEQVLHQVVLQEQIEMPQMEVMFPEMLQKQIHHEQQKLRM